VPVSAKGCHEKAKDATLREGVEHVNKEPSKNGLKFENDRVTNKVHYNMYNIQRVSSRKGLDFVWR
jgi:hypothetical protein